MAPLKGIVHNVANARRAPSATSGALAWPQTGSPHKHQRKLKKSNMKASDFTYLRDGVFELEKGDGVHFSDTNGFSLLLYGIVETETTLKELAEAALEDNRLLPIYITGTDHYREYDQGGSKLAEDKRLARPLVEIVPTMSKGQKVFIEARDTSDTGKVCVAKLLDVYSAWEIVRVSPKSLDPTLKEMAISELQEALTESGRENVPFHQQQGHEEMEIVVAKLYIERLEEAVSHYNYFQRNVDPTLQKGEENIHGIYTARQRFLDTAVNAINAGWHEGAKLCYRSYAKSAGLENSLEECLRMEAY
ncbi:MAG: hypothetical protein Q9179_007873 [Wetmoreana sp. 5 TL-2023]